MQLKFLAVLVSSAVCSSLALAAVPNVSEATKASAEAINSDPVMQKIKKELERFDFKELEEENIWHLTTGKYYVTRNDASLICFTIGENSQNSFNIITTHSDTPAFRLKPQNESYENEFWYIDYDKTKNTYSMDYYIDGQVTKTPLTSQEVKDYELIVGMTYLPYEDDRLMPMVSIKDSIKIDVDSALFDLELKNKKKIK